ncbi:hypothetical protein AB1A81_01485 [Bdellovibrio bacteriovorus]|uniref:Lipoprotein n=1 Tax=Bdellovibrio bacteriovorus (strain ATCC 15356 / DSM 50701 / NCIMB 9529 / HD100) TaxID=264462 RepID=Q6MQY5_BDEBA|nr:hypothetical protein [Bdellovibrio bacteriovorus]AHZ85948.1 hypothetical protein EP01_13530 [Bdellovibrio bacteriovorus]BEV66870.1 hypothetical protein Bb109J_c0290 [Bdellovibrio bacteriovorus]CAE77973.1 hypothetical protein predicted by Glimmer/Critica [Bdellovibrio bacteriovorus HD100]
MKALGLSLFLFLASCAHSIHEVHTSDFAPAAPIESGEMVKAYSEQFVIFHFIGNTDYVDEAYNKLMRACPQGQVTAITTQYSTSLGFFSWTNKILMQGLCLPNQAKKI